MTYQGISKIHKRVDRANSNSLVIQNHCWFKIAEARKKIFKLSKNTWSIYSIGTISTNQVCPASTTWQPCKSSLATQSRSNQDATCGPWTTSYRPMNQKQSRLQSRPWTGPERSPTCSTTRTRTPFTNQYKDFATDTTANSMLPSCWINWINSPNETRTGNKTRTGLSPLQPHWSEPQSAYLG